MQPPAVVAGVELLHVHRLDPGPGATRHSDEQRCAAQLGTGAVGDRVGVAVLRIQHSAAPSPEDIDIGSHPNLRCCSWQRFFLPPIHSIPTQRSSAMHSFWHCFNWIPSSLR